MTLFGGSPGTPQKWPFLAFFRGHVRSSASYFGIFRKKYVFDKRGVPPRGVPPLGGPPQGGPPRTLPQGVQTPCPNEILSPAAARIPTPTPKSYNVLDPLGTGEGIEIVLTFINYVLSTNQMSYWL